MGWLSLATRVIPKLWRSGVKVTSTLWKGGSSVVGAVAKNPKTTAVASVATFAGWQKLSHPDESIGTAVGKTLRGGTDGTGDFAHDVVNGYTGENTVEQVKDTTNKVISEIKDTAAETKGLLGTFGDTLKGISSFIGNLFGGNGTNMFGNFFNNLASGKISGWGIGALIAAAYMVFGRTGLLGKVGGALMAMMMIGNNSQRQTQTVALNRRLPFALRQHHGAYALGPYADRKGYGSDVLPSGGVQLVAHVQTEIRQRAGHRRVVRRIHG